MGSANPPTAEIISIIYQNPWSPSQPDGYGYGITVFCSSEDDYKLAGRLMQGGSVVTENKADSSTLVIFPLPFPLGDALPYHVDVQWVASGTPVDWTSPNAVRSPVLTSIIRLTEGQLELKTTGTGANAITTVTAAFFWDSLFPTKGNVAVFDDSGSVVPTIVSHSENSQTLTFTYEETNRPYSIVLRPYSAIKDETHTSDLANHTYGSGITHILPTYRPTITSVDYDGTMVNVIWTTPASLPDGAGAVSYDLLLSCQGGVPQVFPASSTGGQAPLVVSDVSSEQWSVSGRLNFGVIKGPPSDSAPVNTGCVNNVTQATDAGTGIATLTWDDTRSHPSGTTTYNLAFSGSNAPTNVTGQSGTSYPLPSALAANSLVTVSISKTVTTASSVVTTGPYCPPCKLGTSQPNLLSADYDGTTISLSWQAMNEKVREYTATLFINGTASTPTYAAPAGAMNRTFTPANIAPSDTLTVTLQATMEGDAGPGLPANPMDVTFTPAFFLSPQASDEPYVYPATTLSTLPYPPTTPAPTAASIVLYLPNIYSGTLSTSVAKGPFTLAQNTGGNNANYPYTLTIGTDAWTFTTNKIRTTLQSHYKDFLEAVEAAEKAGSGIEPWGISVLQEAIARHMPQTFAETLYYNYGLDLANGWVDLRPGMVLRVMPSDFMVVPDFDRGNKTMKYLNGYVNASPMDYDIGSYTSSSGWMVGFDAFISRLVAGGALNVDAPPTRASNVGSVAEAADLYSPTFQQPFYRLFIPTTLLSPDDPGSTKPSEHFALAAAASYTALEGTTNGATGNTNAYYRGRAILKLCIRVSINGNEAVVPIGTTVANVLERVGRVPPKGTIQLDGIRLERAIGQTDTVGDPACDVGRSYAVRFDYQPLVAYSNGQSALDLPLLHGDKLTF